MNLMSTTSANQSPVCVPFFHSLFVIPNTQSQDLSNTEMTKHLYFYPEETDSPIANSNHQNWRQCTLVTLTTSTLMRWQTFTMVTWWSQKRELLDKASCMQFVKMSTSMPVSGAREWKYEVLRHRAPFTHITVWYKSTVNHLGHVSILIKYI